MIFTTTEILCDEKSITQRIFPWFLISYFYTTKCYNILVSLKNMNMNLSSSLFLKKLFTQHQPPTPIWLLIYDNNSCPKN